MDYPRNVCRRCNGWLQAHKLVRMFSMLIPETRTSEFFGFFGFLGKSAAMIGIFSHALASTQFDSRVAILTITIVILMGTFLTSRI